jgi:lipoate-protein ligase A
LKFKEKGEIYKQIRNPSKEMQSKSVYKVPNGKLLKIFLDYNEKNNLINKISITGDFFAYPEETIETMENELKNTLLERESLLKKIQSIIKEHNIEFIGLHAEGLTDGILMCKT